MWYIVLCETKTLIIKKVERKSKSNLIKQKLTFSLDERSSNFAFQSYIGVPCCDFVQLGSKYHKLLQLKICGGILKRLGWKNVICHIFL